ncbi:hypothetical protein [Chitinophaga polysaccharea]|uniref:hypothetical protein n=1 Tax=Chitinophaga polysaccharea TaxID=1293035 RepID=UPI0011599954|nr:hypothetical protein [Chitinophaga polysaccharea]
MNLLQKIAGTLFPPYKFNVLRKEEGQLFYAIVESLPEDYALIKEQTSLGTFHGLRLWEGHPGFQFVTFSYGQKTWKSIANKGVNILITGLTIYSKRTRRPEQIELLVRNNTIIGLKITHSNYNLSEFDLNKIGNSHISTSDFEFPPDPIVTLYNALDLNIREKLPLENLEEMEFNNRIFYSFYDLGDGNCLAIDKKCNVYSLVHDTTPMAKGMKISLNDILDKIASGNFDKSKHLDERYKNSNRR